MSTAVKLRKIRRGLHPRHAWIIAVTAVVEIGLRTTRLPRLARLLGVRLGVDAPPSPETVPLDPRVRFGIRRAARAIDRVLRRWPFGDTCLRRALILGVLIRRLDPTLLIGVRRDDDAQIAAHAWLVVAGSTLDPMAAQYLSFGDVTPE